MGPVEPVPCPLHSRLHCLPRRSRFVVSRLSSDSLYALTAPACQKLEDNRLLNDLFLGKLSMDQYCSALQLLFQFYSLVEQRLVQMGMGNLAGPLFYTHLKTPLLEADLDVLDCPTNLAPPASPPPATVRERAIGEGLGAWFVLEQASATWSRLNRLLKRRYGLDGSTGLAFFTNYGNRFDFFWEDFFFFLQGHLRQPPEVERFAASAELTATLLDQWLEQEPSSSSENQALWHTIEKQILAPDYIESQPEQKASVLGNSAFAEARARRSRLEAFARDKLQQHSS